MTYGKIWPAHPKPCPDELLSSWIVRVAQANGIKLQTLSWQLFGNAVSPWNRDIDRTAPSWLISAFSKHTGQPYWDLFHTTLATYRTRLYRHRRLSGQLAWILPVNNHGMNRQSYGQQFCPKCLVEGPFPYFRKQWRIALFTYCPVHQIALHDACPNCQAPVVHYRGDFGKNLEEATPMNQCYLCGFDYRQAAPQKSIFYSTEIESIYTALLKSLILYTSGAERFDSSFLSVLHQLVRVLHTNSNQGKLEAFLSERLIAPSAGVKPGRKSIEVRSLKERHHLIMLGLWLMTDLQPRLTEAWQAKALRYNLMNKDLKPVPGWYRKLVSAFSDWRHAG